MADGAPVDLMANLEVSGEGTSVDLMGDDSTIEPSVADSLMGAEGAGESAGELLGDDVLRGELFSPKPQGSFVEKEDGEAGGAQFESIAAPKESAEPAQQATDGNAPTTSAAGDGAEASKPEQSAAEPVAATSGGESEFLKDETINPDDYGDEHEQAARRIQNIQRGAKERAKVKEMKERGELPGQQRVKRVQPVNKRESEKSVGEISFYDGIGSHYAGDLLNGRPHGKGEYTFANGNVYKGKFKNGQMDGDGELHFPGYGKYVAKFKEGRATNGSFFFEDGLQYQPQGWKYCVEGDRRFYHEVVDPRFGLTDG